MGRWISQKPGLFKFENPGDVLEGTITGINDSEYGKAYNITTSDGVDQFFFGSTSLNTQLENADGKLCRITYRGDVKTRAGRSMRDFQVEIWDDSEDVA